MTNTEEKERLLKELRDLRNKSEWLSENDKEILDLFINLYEFTKDCKVDQKIIVKDIIQYVREREEEYQEKKTKKQINGSEQIGQ